MYKHICKIRKNVNEEIFFFSREKDFYEEDVESYQETVELVSELEEKKIEVVKEYLKEIKPVLRRGIVESLKESGQIPLNDEEISIIYNLLGYFSTETGRDFLANLDAPDIVRISRKLADVGNLKNKIGSDKIRTLIAEMTGIPLQTISYAESQKLMNLETTLHERVIGQEEAISAIAKAIRRSRLGIQNPNRPIASFLFCGPTGVGKTEVTKALAVSMFGAESDMIRLDMSEFMEKFTISRLIGAPPGYVGYEEGGQLTDAVRRKPYSVVLFDEVEKAHPDVLNILLQILEDGRLTDSQKRLVPFENTVIILTSNAAAEEIQDILNTTRSAKQEALDVLQQQQIETNLTKRDKDLLALIDEDKQYKFYQNEYDGVVKFLDSPIKESFLSDIRDQLQTEFDKSFRDYNEFEVIKNDMKKVKLKREQVYSSEEILSELKEAVLERLSTMFLPEFLNRLDDIIIFQPLKPEELRKICDLMIRLVVERVKKKDIFLTVDETVRLKLTREGYNPAFGARPLRRMITKYVEDLISETVLRDPGKKKERFIKITLDEEGNVVAKGKKEGSSDRQKVNSEKPKRKLKKLIEVAV
jgi:ATP-dependent Clp protease ATP-binding subunit ClpA